ncbi:DUF1178 family protein [Aestuariicoccus sp. MJ-SS9]|uniref:DUF1178 family protein n=1 Tax=Aestuariicoccus sp. MJ-SS9 TaxID=3079855 RepID=UPI00291164E5|nr:DUF1178 family protein [Aestuariicoccus sp. MJ-SS9]MDU8910324.1 DUF1178 family protein [Aestuariicoccus sp. MJ-SS9]
MIHYALKCANDHQFESWFQSAAAFDKLKSAGMVTCSVCGATDVEKAVMAPRVNARPKDEASLTKPKSPSEQALAQLKRHVEENTDYVGGNFAQEARAIHSGDAPERPIWGETRGDEAKKLIEEGVPVLPLPFTPTRKSN